MVVLENKSRIPDIYFAYNKDFDYRKYLEEKSHSDEVVLAVTRSTSEIVGSADRLSQRIGTGVQVLSRSIDRVGEVVTEGLNRVEGKLDGIDQTLQSGFEALSFDLGKIDSSISELSYICELGFDKLAAHMIRSNELLDELVTLFKTPDQVWAREQFEYAKACVEKELWDDALKYSDKSIHGDERNSGFHIEPAFHFLRGKILIQHPEVGVGDEFLRLALGSFRDAAKYCGKEHQKLESLSLLNVSWCHYCLGDFHDAIQAIRDSIDRDGSNPLAHFLRAKYEVRAGDSKSSGTSLGHAILADEILFVRAANDQDFIQSGLDLEKTARLARDYRRDQFDKFCKEVHFDEIVKLEKFASSISISTADRVNIETAELKFVIRVIEKYKSDQTLTSLNTFFLRGSENFPCVALEIKAVAGKARDEVTSTIKEQISRLKSDQHVDRVVTKAQIGRPFVKNEASGLAILSSIGAFVLTLWYLWSLPSEAHFVWQLPIAIGRFLVALLAFPAVFIGFRVFESLKAEGLVQRKLTDENEKAQTINKISSDRVRNSHAKAKELEDRLKSISSE